jgi:hypothetical protein
MADYCQLATSAGCASIHAVDHNDDLAPSTARY